MKHIFQNSIAVILLGVGLLSCSYAQSSSTNPCKNPEFGFAEEGFANCKPQDAFTRLEELAKRDDPKALYMLGRVYDLGGDAFGLPIVKQDYDLAMRYYVQSAKLGYAEAQDTIGLYYWKFYHGTRIKEANYWACRAAIQNYPPAVAGIQLANKVAGLSETVQQYCARILASPPKDVK